MNKEMVITGTLMIAVLINCLTIVSNKKMIERFDELHEEMSGISILCEHPEEN